jgi:hypothetical protein
VRTCHSSSATGERWTNGTPTINVSYTIARTHICESCAHVHNTHKRGVNSRDPEGESLQLRLESFEVVKGKPIDVNWYARP